MKVQILCSVKQLKLFKSLLLKEREGGREQEREKEREREKRGERKRERGTEKRRERERGREEGWRGKISNKALLQAAKG